MDVIAILQTIIIHLVIAFVALLWNHIQSWFRGHRFENLILREIEEAGPDKECPETARWDNHQTSQKLLEKAVDNRDFILTLNPDLVYFVTQLWCSKKSHDSHQWLYYLYKIAKYSRRIFIQDV